MAPPLGIVAAGSSCRLAYRAALGLILVLAAPAVAWDPAPVVGQLTQAAFAEDDLPQINKDGWTPASKCGACHQAIHGVWRQSLHANAWSNKIFQAGYRRAQETYTVSTSRVCLKCHAPTVRHGQDYAVEQAVTAEGVTCDFCHSVASVDLKDAADPFRLTIGKTKYGPLKNAQSPAHEIINSELHTRSEFCAGCHEYRTAYGVAVLGTYSEWKNSAYAKRGTQCQDCHMPLVPGRTVALAVKRDAGSMVNLHNISGSHDIEQVRKAVTLEFEGHEWFTDRVRVYLRVTNKGSGHCFPTGLPMHRAVLEVTIRDRAKLVDAREIPFEIVMLDKKGRPLHREHEVFVQAARIRSDTRLKPQEVRSIEVSFRDIEALKLAMTATLYYEYATETLIVEEEQERIEPVRMKFLVASIQRTLKPLGR